jgi:cell division septation protein DedD
LHSPKPPVDQGVVLNDIFHQQAVRTESGNNPSVRPQKADPVPPMAIVTSPVDGKEAGFTIQVYSFQDKNRAQTALQTLKNSGYQAFLIVSDLGEKGTWYRVRVGGIADEAAARKMLDEIRKNYNSGFILKPRT